MSETVSIDLDGAPEAIAAVLEKYEVDIAVGIPGLLLANTMLSSLQTLVQFAEHVRFVDAFSGVGFVDDGSEFDDDDF